MNGNKNWEVIDFIRLTLNAASMISLYPWYQKVDSLNLLTGKLPGVSEQSANFLFYSFLFYPFFVLSIFILSLWLVAAERKYLAAFVSVLPFVYLLGLFGLAKKLAGAVAHGIKKEIIETVVKPVGTGIFKKIF